MASPPDTGRPYGGGVLAGLLASLPVVGPPLAALCLSCLGVGGAVAAGASFSIPTPPLIAAGLAALALSRWRSMRRAQQACGPAECKRLAMRLPLLLGGVAVGTYLVMRLVAVPLLVRGLVELGGAFSHQPTLP